MAMSKDELRKVFEEQRQSLYRTIADKVEAELSAESIKQIRTRPCPGEMHFGLGLYIRNAFIHSDPSIGGDPDMISGEVLATICRDSLPEYEPYPLYWHRLMNDDLATDMHSYAATVLGRDLASEVMRHYHVLEECEAYRDTNPYDILNDDEFDSWAEFAHGAGEMEAEFDHLVAEDLWSFDERLPDLIARGAKRDEVEGYVIHAREALKPGETRPAFLPFELMYYLLPTPSNAEVAKAESALTWALHGTGWHDYSKCFPSWLYSCRPAALVMASHCGRLLERMPSFADDLELVEAAVTNWSKAIESASPRLQATREIQLLAARGADGTDFFEGPFMSGLNDDRELVVLALQSNGANIASVSDGLKHDFDIAMLAVCNNRDFYPEAAYTELPLEMKENKQIALKVAAWERTPTVFPVESLRDDDAIGDVLAQHEDRYSLYGMSWRIKEKYMTPDELERWGDEPFWPDETDDEEEEQGAH